MAEVYYAKDPMKMLGFDQPLPTLETLKTEYAKVCEINKSRDEIFAELNYNPRKYIEYPLPSGILHTSMSVGDVVKDGNILYACSVVGWTKIEVIN